MGTQLLSGFERSEIRESVGLGAVDVALVVAFVTYGYVDHGGDPLADPAATAETVAPFLLGWVVAVLLTGLYRRTLARDPIQAARYTTLCWLAAANIGLALRSTELVAGNTVGPFPLVMTGVGLVVLVPWRVGYAVVGNRRR